MTKAWGKRGEAAVGTTIIYIAMLSMSATAGSVILDNTNMGAQEAQETFDDSLEQVLNHLDIRSVVGICDPDRGEVTSFEILVVLGAGSNDLNLSDLTIEVILSETHLLLVNDTGGFSAELISPRELNNSSGVITDGSFWLLRFELPEPAHGGDEVRISIMPVNGYANFVIIHIPDNITAKYVSLR